MQPGSARIPDHQSDRPPSLLQVLASIVVLLAVIGLSAYIFSIRDQAARFGAYGYPGIFLISALANATVILPAPGVAVVFAMGSVFPPPFVALSAAGGATLGESLAYAAGFGGQALLARTVMYARILPWMDRYGVLTTFLLAAIPNPFFDLAGIAAGALRMPLPRFLFWCFLGKTVKMLAFAYTGAYSIDWLNRLAG